MSNKIQIKRGSKAPGNGVLDVGELGYDTVNKAFYIGNGSTLAPTKFKPSEIEANFIAVPNANQPSYTIYPTLVGGSNQQEVKINNSFYLWCGSNLVYLSVGNSNSNGPIKGSISFHDGKGKYTNLQSSTLEGSGQLITVTLPSKDGTLLLAKKEEIINALGYTPPTSDTNTTYTFATGDSNGQIKITPSSGTAQNVTVKGLGTAAYTNSTAYLAASATAASAKKVTSPLSIQLNGGTATTFDGSAAKSINITPANIGAIAENKIRQELWNGSWSSKKQTIPNSDKYSIFLICLDGVGTPIIAAKYDNYIRGIGGHRLDSGNLIMYQFTGTFSGTTWTMSSCTSVTHTSSGHGDHSDRIVKRVYGVL